MAYRLGSKLSASFDFSSKKQSLVTRSSSESEIYVEDKVYHDIKWLRQLLKFLRCPQLQLTLIHKGNESSIFLAYGDTKYSNNSKHIQWRYYYALQAMKEGTSKLQHIPAREQIADILTKHIESPKLNHYSRSLLMNCSNIKSGI